jgi:hypothetical protein
MYNSSSVCKYQWTAAQPGGLDGVIRANGLRYAITTPYLYEKEHSMADSSTDIFDILHTTRAMRRLNGQWGQSPDLALSGAEGPHY